MFEPAHDSAVRAAAFEWLSRAVDLYGDILPRHLLAEGFVFHGTRVPLLGPPGIFKPRVLHDVPLSITTAPEGPYDDAFGTDGLLQYRYRGSDPSHPDNRGLHAAMTRRLPLIYFHGIVPGKYVPAWPVFVVGANSAALTFSVAVDDSAHARLGASEQPPGVREDSDNARRAYITAAVRVRLHQRAFRERVLEAYSRQCAFCRFRHEELLDAAHIIPDSEPEGEPLVRNGLSLCSLHHGAFDRSFVALRPDYTLEVRADILEEQDGPTLVHGIQALHGSRIVLPSSPTSWPDRTLVEMRYERFRQAAV